MVVISHLSELATLTDLPTDVPITEIIKKCASFLTIRNDVIYFVHQSTNDYLAKCAESEILSDGGAKGHVMIVSQSLHAMSNTFRRHIWIPVVQLSRSITPIQILSLEFGMLVFIGSTISMTLIMVCTIKSIYVITEKSIYF